MELKPVVFIRADANSEVGMGHLIRCLALAQMLRNDFEVIFVTKNTGIMILDKFIGNSFRHESIPANIQLYEEPEYIKSISTIGKLTCLVLDGYRFDTVYMAACRLNTDKLVVIDDLVTYHYSCDAIINQADFVTETQYAGTGIGFFCLGPAFALLRNDFLVEAKKQSKKAGPIEKVFVSLGGADADNLTYDILRRLQLFEQIKHISVLTGPVNENIKNWQEQFNSRSNITFYNNLSGEAVCNLISTSDLAICPASSLSMEVCACRTPLLVGKTANNQSGIYRSLTLHGAAKGVGDWGSLTEVEIDVALNAALAWNSTERNMMMTAQRQYIDGFSGERMTSLFKQLTHVD